MQSRRRTIYLLLGGLLLAVGTPAWLSVVRPGMSTYLLDPVLFTCQAAPYLLAAVLWLPWTSSRAVKVGQWLATALLIVSALLYIPMITGLLPMGGDMVGLGFILIAVVTLISIVVISLAAWGILWLRGRPQDDGVPSSGLR